MMKPTVLTIAGSDCSGGAGIQADLKTMTVHGVYGMSVVTSLTAQNTTGVYAIFDVSADFLRLQLDAVFEDIFPDAVKLGMISSAAQTEAIAERLAFYRPRYTVVDPVMVATSGARLMQEDAVAALQGALLPLASLITPNIPEAEILSGICISGREDMERAARTLFDRYGCAVLVKGGHGVKDADDLLCTDKGRVWFRGERIRNPNTHGTGCTLSAAIASNLAKGASMEDAVRRAKEYISGALAAMLDLGRGRGPMDHAFCLRGGYAAMTDEKK